MTTVAQPTDIVPTFETSSQIPIADISPSYDDASVYIQAQVALVWPYSSSTGTFALLLADTDIRRRKSRGQVKVVFRHGCAREVAKTKVGIGDTVKLALEASVLTETGDAVSTPGKKIDWDLEYRRRVILRVLQDGRETSAVDYASNDSDAAARNGTVALLNGAYITRPSVNGVLHRQPSTIHVPYLTPRKTLPSGSTGTFIDVAFDYSAEDYGYIPGQGRKRTKFARNSGAWSLVDDEEELQLRPEEQEQANQIERADLTIDSWEHPERYQAERERTKHAPTNIPSPFEAMSSPHRDVIEALSSPAPAPAIESPPVSLSPAMGPPSTPVRALRLQFSLGEVDAPQASPISDATSTPRLHPIPSPGLPLVSPLLQRTGVEVGYFPAFEVRASQLDASGDSIAPASIHEGRFPREADVATLRSDDSSLVVEQLSTLQEAGERSQAGIVRHPDHLVLDECMTRADTWNSMSTARDSESQFLSPMEPETNRELRSDKPAVVQNPSVPQSLSGVAEIEDDDMYGAPAGGHRTNGLLANQLSVETPKTPLDVLEQFLQLSPATAAGPSTSFESGGETNTAITPVPSLRQSVSDSITTDTRQNKTSASTLKHSPVTYPESQSPFRQNRDQQTSSNASSRPSSSHRARLYSLDGAADAQEPFAEYINHLAQIAASAESMQHPTTDIVPQEDKIQKGTSLAAVAPAAVIELNEVIRSEGAKGAAEEEPRHIEGTTLIDTLEVANQLIRTQPTHVQPRDATAVRPLEPLHTPGAQGQLLTPDHSQMQQFSTEPQAETELKQPEEAVDIALPSPRYTQEEAVILEIEEATFEVQGDTSPAIRQDEVATQTTVELELSQQAQEEPTVGDQESAQAIAEEVTELSNEEGADSAQAEVIEEATLPTAVEEELPKELAVASATPAKLTDMQPDTTTPLRISQRLSARKSIMTSNISSPYFTPRKSALAPSSSPIRKENIHPASLDRSNLPSSRIQDRDKAPSLQPSAVEEVEQNGITPGSPNKARRPISRRHTGATTPLAYYAHLSSLHEHFGQVVDILAVCTESSSKPDRAKSGPKDYHVTLRVADASLASDEQAAIPVQIFRHARDALPTANGGDVVIIRNFKVQTTKRKFMLLSTETSSWVVFKAKPDSSMSWSDVVISGPPIEYGPAETSRVKLLFSWWNSNGKQRSFRNTSTHNHENIELSSPKLRSKSPQRTENAQSASKARPANRRRLANETDNFNNEDAVENFFASFNSRVDGSVADDSVDEEAANSAAAKPPVRPEVNMKDNVNNEPDTAKLSPRTARRRKANRADHFGNEGDEDTNMADYDRGKSVPLMDTTNRRRQSIISLAASESGTTLTPRRSTRQKQRKSPSVVHELRDGTKYADNDQGKGGAVVHELRDGATYVDE